MDTGADKTVPLARVDWLPDFGAWPSSGSRACRTGWSCCDSGTGRAQTILTETDRSDQHPDDLHFSPMASASCGPANAPVSVISISTIFPASSWCSSRTATGKWQAWSPWTKPPAKCIHPRSQPHRAPSLSFRSPAATRFRSLVTAAATA